MPIRSGKIFSIRENFAPMDSSIQDELDAKSLIGWARWINDYKSLEIRLTPIRINQTT